jgi:hypothetical protein
LGTKIPFQQFLQFIKQAAFMRFLCKRHWLNYFFEFNLMQIQLTVLTNHENASTRMPSLTSYAIAFKPRLK